MKRRIRRRAVWLILASLMVASAAQKGVSDDHYSSMISAMPPAQTSAAGLTQSQYASMMSGMSAQTPAVGTIGAAILGGTPAAPTTRIYLCDKTCYTFLPPDYKTRVYDPSKANALCYGIWSFNGGYGVKPWTCAEHEAHRDPVSGLLIFPPEMYNGPSINYYNLP
jgi:hypothetical protein